MAHAELNVSVGSPLAIFQVLPYLPSPISRNMADCNWISNTMFSSANRILKSSTCAIHASTPKAMVEWEGSEPNEAVRCHTSVDDEQPSYSIRVVFVKELIPERSAKRRTWQPEQHSSNPFPVRAP